VSGLRKTGNGGSKVSRVGENIKRLRMNSNMTQKQLAKKLGVAESFINEVETGKKVINEAMISKMSKVLGKEINDIGMSVEEQVAQEVEVKPSVMKRDITSKKQEDVQEVWNSAFGSVMKNVPVYKYDLGKAVQSKLLPVQGNKIEGYSQDKVFFLEIEDDDMIGFRIAKGDIAFVHQVSEPENNSICLIEYNSERVIRQIKKLDNSKLLLISNKGSLRTETASIKEIKIIGKLDRVEIKL
jgi:transcriptional regulator with XRE-family HTH domain